MDFGEKTIRRLAVILLIVILGVLVFFLIKPVAVSIIGGLLLAYTFVPVFNVISRYIKEKNTATVFVSILGILIIGIPLWFVIPILIQQSFELFKFTQTLDVQGFVKAILPTASESFITQLSVMLNGFVSKITLAILNSSSDFFLNLPTLLLNSAIVIFVFFFALRDKEQFKEYASSLSPLAKPQEKIIVKQFKDITDSIVYGQVIVGLVQGLIAGFSFLIFGVPNALILTILAVFLSIIPIIGPSIVWFPVAIYLFASGNIFIAVMFLLYNLLITSVIDNLLRIYIISKKANISQVVILIGMVGGLFIFGLLGLILGPLILAYFLTFLKAYKEKNLGTLFAE